MSHSNLKLYMLLLGCKPSGRHTEQHDIFFSIATSLKELVPQIYAFWPRAGTIHIDAWREVRYVSGFEIKIFENQFEEKYDEKTKLFFINLGGYKKDEFEEYHYKIIVAASDKGSAIRKAKETAFYKYTGFKGAESHIDDKYGIDVDDVYAISDILPASIKEKYSITLSPTEHQSEDEMHLGYFILDKL